MVENLFEIAQNADIKNYAVAYLEQIKHLRWNVFAKIVNGITLTFFAKTLFNSSYATIIRQRNGTVKARILMNVSKNHLYVIEVIHYVS